MKSHVVESFGAILLHAAAPRVEVRGPQGVLPAVRGPLVAQEADEGRALDESGGDNLPPCIPIYRT